MIHGSFCSIPVTLPQSPSDVPKVVLGVSLVASNHRPTVSSNRQAHIEIKQVHSTDRMTSATVGHSPHRSVMCTHLKHCQGSRCMCSEICSFFLADSSGSSLSDFVLKHVPVMKDKLCYPYLIVLAQGGETIKVSCNDGNVLTQSILPGCYDIRDSFMWPSVAPSNPHVPSPASLTALHSTHEVEELFASPPRTTSTAAPSTACAVLEPLVRDWAQVLDLPACMNNMQLCGGEEDFYGDENASESQLNSQPWKKRALGGLATISSQGKSARANTNNTGGLTVSTTVATALRDAHCSKYLNSGTAEGLTLLRHRHTRELHSTALTPAVHRAVAIKKPVNAYNFFSMDERARMRHGNSTGLDDEDERSNNEWNREVGRRWTVMTPLMRHPYELRAVEDSLRYTQECEQQGLSEDARRKGVTAYNLFVAQERCFTTGLNIADLKKRNGQHCSYRWATMRREEKRLYEQMAVCENRKRNRQ